MTEQLPWPECGGGYTWSQLNGILGDRLDDFKEWMYGQTMALCEGRKWSYEAGEYIPACNGAAHGVVVYPWDLQRYLDGGPIID